MRYWPAARIGRIGLECRPKGAGLDLNGWRFTMSYIWKGYEASTLQSS